MIRLIAAVDDKMGIARQGQEPADLPGERKYFKQLTMQHGGVLLMGRRTYEQIGRPLPGRQNCVLTRTMPDTPGLMIVRDLDTFLASHPEVWIVGGESVFRQTLDHADEVYLTRIRADFGCNQFFPAFPADRFELKTRSPAQRDNDLSFYYEVYRRVS